MQSEIVLVDDGSTVPAAETLNATLGDARVLRTTNRGLLFARLTGLANAQGKYVLFLDSDDLVSESKLLAQFETMERDALDISYTNAAKATLDRGIEDLELLDEVPYLSVNDPAEFCFHVQPAPHSPMFRRAFLTRAVESALFPPLSQYNPVAELWFYYVCAHMPGRVQKVERSRAVIGVHGDSRITNHWETLGLGSLAVMEDYLTSIAKLPNSKRLTQMLSEVAFRSWRRLPRDFHRVFVDRMLAIASAAKNLDSSRSGGPLFQILAGLFGDRRSAEWLKSLRGHSYDSCRTMTDDEWERLLHKFNTRHVNH